MKQVPIYILIILLFSCHKSTPAGFWKNFDEQDIKVDSSDQGPWGGSRVIYWKKTEGKFSENEILKYASVNNWKLADIKVVGSEIVDKWLSNAHAIFPLDKNGLHISVAAESGGYNFPRWINGSCRLYKFDSGWMVVNAGTSDSKIAYGYILLSGDYTRMAVYHLWGE